MIKRLISLIYRRNENRGSTMPTTTRADDRHAFEERRRELEKRVELLRIRVDVMVRRP